MTPEKDKALCEKYPSIFRDRHGNIRETCMCWGLEIGDGWHEIIEGLCAKLSLVEASSGISAVAVQVKEKFGGLRFYYHPETDGGDPDGLWYEIIRDIVSAAEARSYHTCEKCGDYGRPNKEGWIVTLCEKCREDRHES